MAQLLPADNLSQLAAEARAKRVPVLIAFMQESCPYCAVARRDYLLPLQSDPQWRHRAFARSHDARRVPTLIVFDADGNRVGPPLIGLLTADFYRLYIEQGIEAGLARMRKR